jgi:hypothetical protein
MVGSPTPPGSEQIPEMLLRPAIESHKFPRVPLSSYEAGELIGTLAVLSPDQGLSSYDIITYLALFDNFSQVRYNVKY